jgi:hypothetical protein
VVVVVVEVVVEVGVVVVVVVVVQLINVIIYAAFLPTSKTYSDRFQFCAVVILQVVSARISASGGHLSSSAELRLPDSYNPRHKLVSLACPMFCLPLSHYDILQEQRIVTNAWKNKFLPLCRVTSTKNLINIGHS